MERSLIRELTVFIFVLLFIDKAPSQELSEFTGNPITAADLADLQGIKELVLGSNCQRGGMSDSWQRSP